MINGQTHAHISDFMNKHSVPVGLRLFVVRTDGLLVWDARPDQQSQALAALCSGVWEAAGAMAKVAGQGELQDFRFVFDSTDRGVFIFPMFNKKQPFYLAAIYERCVNPALLKRQVHSLGEKLCRYLDSLPQQRSVQVKTIKREGYLFSDISDAEMDRLFGI
ncbi:MAG: roadblock/LC7 domain-containing protein [Bacteriovoracaceae bacterium]|nr:roadblock/LC7 domain-containing protein [Bacteriovoracaceae bacterium]